MKAVVVLVLDGLHRDHKSHDAIIKARGRSIRDHPSRCKLPDKVPHLIP